MKTQDFNRICMASLWRWELWAIVALAAFSIIVEIFRDTLDCVMRGVNRAGNKLGDKLTGRFYQSNKEGSK